MSQHVSNYALDSATIVLDLINATNNTDITFNEVVFTQLIEGEGSNTLLDVEAIAGKGYRGTAQIEYTRVNLNQIPNIGDEPLESDATTVGGIIARINDLYYINLEASDVTVNGYDLSTDADTVIIDQPSPGVAVPVTVTAKAGSYVWMGSYAFDIIPVIIDLGDIWSSAPLDGLYPPLAPQ